MPNQSAKFVSAVFVGVLAGTNFIPALSNSAHADDCLATPNGQTPQGSHWYYHIERGTKRHCWYLRGEGDTQAQSADATTSSPPPAPAKPTPPKAEAAMQGSVANARAELPWPQPPTAPETPAPTVQSPAAAVDNAPSSAPSSDGSQPPSITATAAAGGANMLQTTVASRWPDQANASASDDSAPAADNQDTNAQQPDTASAQPPAAAAVPLVTADTPPSSKQPGSIQMLLTAMIVALALAGLVGGVILRFGRRKQEDREEVDADRRPIWDSEHSDPLPYPAAAARRPNIGLPHELRTVEEPNDKITEMLVRLARSAQT